MADFDQTATSTALAEEVTTTTGGGAPPPEPAKTETPRESLQAVMKDVDQEREAPKVEKAEEQPTEKKPVEAEKPAKAEPAKAEPSDDDKAAEREAAQTERQEQGTRPEPPKRFSEGSKAVWRNVPREVQGEISRWERESEEAKPRLERYESIRQFDELAKANGRDLRESLAKINQFENMMRTNPIGALHSILAEIGPRKADGQAVSLFEIASHIVNSGQEGYSRSIAAANAQQQQEKQSQAFEQQRSEMVRMQDQMIRTTVIDPFKASHPRYDELEDDIAMFLKSGKITPTLSVHEKLSMAYEMAERLNPASVYRREDNVQALDPARRADTDFSGSKSIRSSPGAVSDADMEDQAKGGESILDSVRAEARRMIRR
jgi:hypothetical protein